MPAIYDDPGAVHVRYSPNSNADSNENAAVINNNLCQFLSKSFVLFAATPAELTNVISQLPTSHKGKLILKSPKLPIKLTYIMSEYLGTSAVFRSAVIACNGLLVIKLICSEIFVPGNVIVLANFET